MTATLENIRVIEFAEGIAGPLAALRLGDLGAKVVKVEGRQGDFMREAEPALPSGVSAAFFALNRGKKSIALGPNPAVAASFLLSLLATADVFITDRSEVDLQALGLGKALVPGWKRNPRLIIADISVWGRQGPLAERAGAELGVQAMAGYTGYLGAKDIPPERLGADVSGTGTAAFTVQGILAALYARQLGDGVGQRISTSLLNTLISMESIHLAAQSEPDQFTGPRVGGPYNPPERGWQTSDGPIFIEFGGSVGAEGRPGWAKFVQDIGLGALLEDARLDHNGRNSTGFGAFVQMMRPVYEEHFANYKSDDLVDRIRSLAGNATTYMRAEATLAHPQTKALDLVRAVAGAESDVNVLAFPGRFSEIKTKLHGRAPALGEHGAAVAAATGLSAEEITSLQAAGGLLETNEER